MCNATELVCQLEQDKVVIAALIANIENMQKLTKYYALGANDNNESFEELAEIYRINSKIQKEVLEVYTRRSALSEMLLSEMM